MIETFRVIASRHRVWLWIAIFLTFVLAFLAFVIYLPRLSFVVPTGGLTAAERARAQSDFRGHLLQAFAGLVLIVGAYFTARTFALNREGQITERFTRAVEQLANNEKLDVRLGGIYALERIARDSETHYEPVLEVLTAFLREHAPWRPGSAPAASGAGKGSWDPSMVVPSGIPDLGVDVRAVATVLARRDRRHEGPDYRLNLGNVDLHGVDLARAYLGRAELTNAHLVRAELTGAHLEGAHLYQAHLEGARLNGANLEGADLKEAHLEGAAFLGAKLQGANLYHAHLEDASFFGAYLERANLIVADLKRANLGSAHLEEARLENANLSDALLDGANLKKADLRGATGLTQEQLDAAITDDDTILPDYLRHEPAKP